MKKYWWYLIIPAFWLAMVFYVGYNSEVKSEGFGEVDAAKKIGCKFEGPEAEEGTISRVQEYNPPFALCGIKYVGKITILENGVRYRAFVYSGNKDPRFPQQTAVYDGQGKPIPLDALVEKLKEGRIVDYIFALRILDKVIPGEEKGLLVELRVREK